MSISHKLIESILKAVCGFQVSIANLKSLLKYTLPMKKTTKICVPFKVSSKNKIKNKAQSFKTWTFRTSTVVQWWRQPSNAADRGPGPGWEPKISQACTPQQRLHTAAKAWHRQIILKNKNRTSYPLSPQLWLLLNVWSFPPPKNIFSVGSVTHTIT